MNMRNILLITVASIAISFFAHCAALAQFTSIGSNLPKLPPIDTFIWGDYDNDGNLDFAVAGFGVAKIYHNDGNGKFTDALINLAGVSNCSMAWGDYDNDGNLDLAIAGNAGTNRQSFAAAIYRNDGNGNFINIGANLTGVRWGSLAWGDYDNDGRLDLAIAGNVGTKDITKIYHNDGNGVFTVAAPRLYGVSMCSIAWGDYDNDGNIDLAITGASISKTLIYHNDGNGNFTDIGANIIGVSYCSLAWGDYDNDGDLDLAIAGHNGSSIAKIYRNDGDGVFTDIAAKLYGCGYSYNNNHCSLSWGDYDNDGDLDLIISGYNGTDCRSRIYRNDANGVFTSINTNLIAAYTVSTSWGDYDNDNDIDLAISASDTRSGTAMIYNNNIVTQNAAPSAPSNPNATVSGNTVTFNWDTAKDDHTPAAGLSYNIRVGTTPGANDIFSGMANSNGRRKIPGIGNAQIKKSWSIKIPAGTYYWSMQAIDTSYIGSVWTPEQSFTITPKKISGHIKLASGEGISGVYISATNSTSTAISDINGYYELQIGSGWSGTITPQKDGISFSPVSITYSNITEDQINQDYTEILIAVNANFPQLFDASLAWGDYDNDGDLDLAIAGYNKATTTNTTRIYRNDGNCVFTDINAGLPGVHECSIAWGDYDNDGYIDLAISGDAGSYSNPIYGTWIYRNNGNGQFVDTHADLTGVTSSSIAWGDYDNDGDLDLVISGCSNIDQYANVTRITKIYRNDKGAFTDINANLSGTRYGTVKWGDYDNDGKFDLAIAGSCTPKIYHNDGDGKFSDIGANLFGVYNSVSLAWGDYDNDGDLDLAIAGDYFQSGKYYCSTKIYRNDGNGKFTDINTNIIGLGSPCLDWGDFDNDGKLDLAIIGCIGSDNAGDICFTKIYHNAGNDTFVDSHANLPGVDSGSIAWGDYNNDGKLDLAFTGSGIIKIYQNDISAHTTPPSAPSGLSTTINANNATFTWNATSLLGLSYNLRVGTKPGSGDICNGMASSNGLRKIPALGNAQKRLSWTLENIPTNNIYWSVQAIDTSYVGSMWAAEQVITTQASVAKSLANGSSVMIKGVISAVFADCCYVQSEDRSSGIRVETTAAVKEGDKVYVSGKVNRNSNGERYIENATITPADS